MNHLNNIIIIFQQLNTHSKHLQYLCLIAKILHIFLLYIILPQLLQIRV